MKVTAAPLALGSITPIVSPGAEIAATFRASTPTPMRKARKVSAPLSGSSTATRERPRAFADSSNAANTVRRMSNVTNRRSDIMSKSAGPAARRLARPRKSAGVASRRGGRTVTVTFGKRRLPT